MERINGFIDLDKYYKETKQKGSLLDILFDYRGYEKVEYGKEDQYWLKIDGDTYYFKSKNPYIELIAYECAVYLDLEAVPYDLAIYKGKKGVISKNFRKKGYKYIPGYQVLNLYMDNLDGRKDLEDMGLLNHPCYDIEFTKPVPWAINNLEIIWQALEDRYKGKNIDIGKIMNSFILRFIFNILLAQSDGMPQNWELAESKNDVFLVPIYDNELCLDICHDSLVTCPYEIDPECNLSTNFNDADRNNYEILKEFLSISSSEYFDLFLEKYNLLTTETFIQIIVKIEEKIGCEIPKNIKSDFINSFYYNRNNIEKVLNEFNYSKKRIKAVK